MEGILKAFKKKILDVKQVHGTKVVKRKRKEMYGEEMRSEK